MNEDFDWVGSRSGCSSDVAFERLKGEIEADVAARNAKRPSHHAYGFSSRSDIDCIAVNLDGNAVLKKVIKFRKTAGGISVHDINDSQIFEASLILNNDGECRFLIDGKECRSWQLRYKALEGLFFGEIFRKS